MRKIIVICLVLMMSLGVVYADFEGTTAEFDIKNDVKIVHKIERPEKDKEFTFSIEPLNGSLAQDIKTISLVDSSVKTVSLKFDVPGDYFYKITQTTKQKAPQKEEDPAWILDKTSYVVGVKVTSTSDNKLNSVIWINNENKEKVNAASFVNTWTIDTSVAGGNDRPDTEGGPNTPNNPNAPNNPSNPSGPNTGDLNNIILWITLLGSSAAFLVALFFKNNKKNTNIEAQL